MCGSFAARDRLDPSCHAVALMFNKRRLSPSIVPV